MTTTAQDEASTLIRTIALRTKRSQAEIGDLIGVSQGRISALKRCGTEPTQKELAGLRASAGGLGPDDGVGAWLRGLMARERLDASDVAAVAGVPGATVSRILNDNPCRSATRVKIEAAVAQIASSGRRTRTRTAAKTRRRQTTSSHATPTNPTPSDAIVVSKRLIRELPEAERKGAVQALWNKSGGRCHLCDGSLDRLGNERIVADHDIPRTAVGPTTLANLNLAHNSCNSFKQNNPTVHVRPFLRVRRIFISLGRSPSYAECVSGLGWPAPQSVELSIKGDEVVATFTGGRRGTGLIRTESRASGETWRAAYLDVPLDAVHHDQECQPRSIKQQHLWALYCDLMANPLYEAPGCRLTSPGTSGLQNILMFDGQHKAIAARLHGAESLTIKLYLDIDRAATTRLVNSIQGSIPKLPLSPFEYTAKMSAEYAESWLAYEQKVSADEASERGWIASLPASERRRAKSALASALLHRVVADPDLLLLDRVRRAGASTQSGSITEKQFESKILKRLMRVEPIAEARGGDLTTARDNELRNTLFVLNRLARIAFEPNGPAVALSEREQVRAHRFSYQASLTYVAGLVRAIVGNVVHAGAEEAMFEELDEAQQQYVGTALDRIMGHAVWFDDLHATPAMERVGLAFSKNQDIDGAFSTAGLTASYALGLTG